MLGEPFHKVDLTSTHQILNNRASRPVMVQVLSVSSLWLSNGSEVTGDCSPTTAYSSVCIMTSIVKNTAFLTMKKHVSQPFSQPFDLLPIKRLWKKSPFTTFHNLFRILDNMKSIINLSRQLSKAKIRHADALAKFLLEGTCTHLDSVNDIPLWISTKQLGWTDSTYSITAIQKALVDAKYVERLSRTGQYMNAFRPTKKLLKATFKYRAEIRELASDHTEKLIDHEIRITQTDHQVADFANQINELQVQLDQTRNVMAENKLATEKQIADIWEAIRNIEQHNPPVTAEKVAQHLKLVTNN